MLVENFINQVSREELEKDTVEIFKEDKEKVEQQIQDIQSWIQNTPHMKNVRDDEEFLRFFLRGCNYDVNASKEKLDLFFTARSVFPSWFLEWDPRDETVQNVLQTGMFLPLRGFDKRGRYPILVRLGQMIPSKMTAEECWKQIIMMFNLINEGNLQAQTKGMVVIIDLENMNSSHVGLVNPSLIRKLLVVFQDAYPMDNEILLSLSNAYFLNMPKMMEKFVNIAISFLNKKYKKILKIQDKSNLTLLDDLGGEILPEEYGGTNQTCDQLTHFWMSEMVKHSDWFNQQVKYKTDESVRQGKSKLHSSCSVM